MTDYVKTMDLAGSVALVTGAGGFLGGHAAIRLAGTERMHVRGLLHRSGFKAHGNADALGIELATGDLLNACSLAPACEGCRVVVHAANKTRTAPRSLAWRTAVDGTANLYQAARAQGVRRFIFISSFAVYYRNWGSRYNEAQPLGHCGDLYADAKIAAETLLRNAAPGGPEVVILRPPLIYGPNSWYWTIQPVQLARRNRLFAPGGGKYALDYVYCDNLVDAVVAAAKADTCSDIYNVFDGQVQYEEFLSFYAEMVGTKVRCLPTPLFHLIAAASDVASRISGVWMPISLASSRPHSGRYSHSTMAAEKARRELDWSPRVDLSEGMRRTRKWLASQGLLG